MSATAQSNQTSLQRTLIRFGSGIVCVTLTAFVLSAVATSQAQVTTIYQDDFSGAGGPLNGTTPDVGAAAWQSGAVYRDDGAVNTVVAPSPNGQAAFLPFTPVAGRVYTLSATVTNAFTDWIAIGFLPALPPGGDWTAQDFSVRHSNNGAHAWMLTRTDPARNDQEAFNGPNTSNGAFGGDLGTSPNPVDFRIVVNTGAATWTAEYFVDGVSRGLFNLAASANTDIGGIGFSRDRTPSGVTGGTIANFLFTEQPAPTAGEWDAGVSSVWSVASNWANNTLPTFTGFSDVIAFAVSGTPGGTVTNDVVGAQLQQINFTADAASFTLTGNAVQISDSMTTQSPNLQTVALDIAATSLFTVNTIGGPVEISGALSGSNGLVKGGGSTLTLSNGANAFSGPISFTDIGNLILTASGALGDAASSITLSSNAFAAPEPTLELDGGVTQQKVYNLNARQIGSVPHILATSGVNTLTGSFNLGGGGPRYILSAATGATLNLNADLAMSSEDEPRLIRCDGEGVINLNGAIDDAPLGQSIGLSKANGAAGELVLSGVQNYSGETTAASGTLTLDAPVSTNSVPNSALLQAIAPDGTLDFSGLSGGGIVLNSGQTLAGDGTFIGSVNAGAGTTLDPGTAALSGVMQLDSLSLGAGATLDLLIDSAGSDMVVVAPGGTFTGPSGVVNIEVSPGAGFGAGTYTILDWTGASASGVQLSDFATDDGVLAIVGSQLQLTVTVETFGDMLVSDTGNHRVLKFNITQFGWATDAVQPVFAEGTVGAFVLDSPVGLAQDSVGNVYIAEGNPDLQDRILKLSPAGAHLATIAEVDSANPLTEFDGTPAHIVVDPTDSYLYFSVPLPNSTAVDTTVDDVIYRVDLSGSTGPAIYIDTTDLAGNYVLFDPQGLEFGPDGYLYVSNNFDPNEPNLPQAGSRVLRFDVSGPTGVFAGVLTTEHRETRGMHYDAILDRLIVSLNGLNDIWAYTDLALDFVANDPANGAFEFIFEQGADEDYPDVITAIGEVYFTDTTTDVVRKVESIDTTSEVVNASAGLLDPHSLLNLSAEHPFDFDGDGDVDAADADMFLSLVNGEGVTTPPAGATVLDFERADIDNDGDVDMADTWILMQQITN